MEKSLWFKYCLPIKNTPGNACKAIITNYRDLLLITLLEIKKLNEFQDQEQDFPELQKTRNIPDLEKTKEIYIFTAIYRQSTGYINNLCFVAVLKQDAQNSIFSLKKNILGCQHADQEIRKLSV